MINAPIYLDYAATTPVDPHVAEKMLQYLTFPHHFGNASSTHHFGINAKAAVEEARAQVAQLIHAEPNEIIWTSGATEANNLALKGIATLYQNKGKHIITLKTEHPAVLDTCQQLEKMGYFVTYLTPETNGLLDIDKLTVALRDDTILVSIMHVNNEIGVIQNIQQIAELTATRGILFHTDAAQSAGKLEINVQKTPVDLISFCAHKIYGPKGIGALYVRRKPRVRVAAQIHGGGHEQGMRSGTLPVHQIVGMGEAFNIAHHNMFSEIEKIKSLHDYFLQGLHSIHYNINGDREQAYPGILNLCFPDITADKLIKSLPELALSVGSACLSKGVEASYVLRALGLSENLARSSIRISFGRFTTKSEVDFAIQGLCDVLGNQYSH